MTYNNNTTLSLISFQTSIQLKDLSDVKIIFGTIMGILCFITTIGNIMVIYRYRKASMVI
jgi:hypothetical protein